MKQMVETAALRPTDYIVVLPMASEVPDEGFALIAKQVGKHTAAPVRNFNFAKHPVTDKAWVDSLAGARLIYILGGDQNRFMKTVLGTPVYGAIHQAYKNGATVAGTSAGAAVMSRYMITGAQLRDSVYKETFDKVWENNIAFAEGLGLLQNTIIDQHFLKRSRHNRLLTALADKPQMVCVGIDEGTAIIVQGAKATVAGESQVLRLANPKGAKATASGLITFESAELGLFANGDSFRIKR
ncbi:cyanophycinase [Flavisolibacter sp. BT320]|nr:cyanophycinase [Flavisolibacter longurius]